MGGGSSFDDGKRTLDSARIHGGCMVGTQDQLGDRWQSKQWRHWRHPGGIAARLTLVAVRVADRILLGRGVVFTGLCRRFDHGRSRQHSVQGFHASRIPGVPQTQVATTAAPLSREAIDGSACGDGRRS